MPACGGRIMDLRVVGRHPVCLVAVAQPNFHYNWWTGVDIHLRRRTEKGPESTGSPAPQARAADLSTFAREHQGWHGLVCCHRRAQERLYHTLCHIRDASFVRRSSSSPTIACWRRATWWMDVYGARSAASYMKTFSARCTRWPGSTTRMRSGRWDPLHRHPRDRCRRPL